ncbi:MAG: phosphoglycerate dehydrogenase [Candidatus Syntropharchaeia archaeon]
MFNILVSDKISEKGIEILRKEANVDVLLDMDKKELIERIGNYDALIVRSDTKVTGDVIEAARRLKVIGRAGVGVDNIDVDAATEKGIIVLNAPEGNMVSAAEHTIAMLLSLSRKIPQADRSLREKKWERRKFMGVEIMDKVLGIIGLGRIGYEVARRAQGIGMRVIAYDPFISSQRAEELGVPLVSFEELLKNSDYISIHTPLTKETKDLIGNEEFELMKDGVRIINCARGGIVNENALIDAIKKGKVAGAALDVFEKEPPYETQHGERLLELEEVIVTPHLGASTEEAQVNVAITVAEQVLCALKNEPVKNAVNMICIQPELIAVLKPYLSLVEKLGKLCSQLISGRMERVEISYQGEISEKDTGPLTIAALKGLLVPILGNTVNYVNAPFIAKNRGIKVVESKTKSAQDFTSLITLSVFTDEMEKTVAGTLFGRDDARIVYIDGYRVDAVPSGYMLISKHINKPKVIGPVGLILGEKGINISGMQVGGGKIGEEAIMVLNIDSSVPKDVLKKVEEVDGIIDVKLVML